MVTAERAIHVLVFFLLLVGLWTLSAWISYMYLNGNLILAIASISLSWGIILLILYVSFEKIGWRWWSPL